MEGYPFEVPVEIRFRDVDAFGHVNNAVYVTYLEQGRVAFFRQVFGLSEATGFDFILARVEIDYRRPLRLEDELRVGLRVESIGKTSYVFGYRLEAGGEVAAIARTVQVSFDYRTRTKIPLPGSFRDRVKPYLVEV